MPYLRQVAAVITGSAGAVAAFLASRHDEINLWASSKHKHKQDKHDHMQEQGVFQEWDYNWDKMAPEKGTERKEGASEVAKSTASRTLILIRHGQYIWDPVDPDKRILTELGKKQAAITGERLKALGHTYSTLYFSTMPRATESAQIIEKSLIGVPTRSCDLMREGAPIRPEPMHKKWKPEAYVS